MKKLLFLLVLFFFAQNAFAYTNINIDQNGVGTLNGKKVRVSYKDYYDLSKNNLEAIQKSGLSGIVLNNKSFIKDGTYSIEEQKTYQQMCQSNLCREFLRGKTIGVTSGKMSIINIESYFKLNSNNFFQSIVKESTGKNAGIIFKLSESSDCSFGTCDYGLVSRLKLVEIGPRSMGVGIKGTSGKTFQEIVFFEEMLVNDNSDFKRLMELTYKKAQEFKKIENKEERIKAIYEYLVKNFKYDESITFETKNSFTEDQWRVKQNREIYSGLRGIERGKFVCQGYVDYMGLLLIFSGIDNVELVEGQSKSQLHIWLKIDGKYYDPTWDSGLYALGNTGYKYYGLSKEEMQRDHIFKE